MWFVVPVLLFFIAGLLLNLLVPYGQEIVLLNDWRNEPFNMLFKMATRMGEAIAFLISGLVALLYRYRFAVLIALAGLVTIPVSYSMKEALRHDRPITWFEQEGLRDTLVLVPGERLNTGKTSFPSGHTMAAFALFGVLSTLLKRRWWQLACAFLPALTGLSRIFLVQHFLRDVLLGALVGLLIAALVHYIDRRFLSKHSGLDRGLLRWSREA
jgi:membrane-associated phospholipid phosphatase